MYCVGSLVNLNNIECQRPTCIVIAWIKGIPISDK